MALKGQAEKFPRIGNISQRRDDAESYDCAQNSENENVKEISKKGFLL